MAQKIQVRRGNESQLPTLSSGEFGLTLDSNKVFVGTPTGNLEMANASQLAEIAYNVKSFGAVGDGVADDTEKIRLADAEASKKGGTVYFPRGYQFRTTDTIQFSTNVNVKMDSPIVFDSAIPKPAIIYGDKNAMTKTRELKFWCYKKTLSNWLDYSTTNSENTMFVGVKLINIGESDVKIVQASNFTLGVEVLASNSQGCYYNRITLGEIRNNASGIELVSENGGWPNGNEFFAGAFSIASNTNMGISRKFISTTVRSGTYGNNSNIFHTPTLEGGTSVNTGVEFIPIQLNKANQLQILNIRGENFAKDYVAKFTDSSDNIITFRVKMTSAPDKLEVGSSTNNNIFTEPIIKRDIKRSLDKTLIFDSGIIRDKMYYQKGVTAPAGISNMLFYTTAIDDPTSYVGRRKTSSGSSNPTFDANGGFSPSSYNMPGIVIDTTNCKKILVENKESSWGLSVALFDVNGNIIRDSVNISNIIGNFYASRWNYNLNNPSTVPYQEFGVSDIVKSVIIMVHGYTKRWKAYTLDGTSIVLKPQITVRPKLYVSGDDANIYQITVDSIGVLKSTLVTE